MYPASTTMSTLSTSTSTGLSAQTFTGYVYQCIGYRKFGPNSRMHRLMIDSEADLKLWMKEAICYISFMGWSDVLHEESPDIEENDMLHSFLMSCIPSYQTKIGYELLMLIGYLVDNNRKGNGRLAWELLCEEYSVKIDQTQDLRPKWCETCVSRDHDASKCKQWCLYKKGKGAWDSGNWYDENLWLGNEKDDEEITSKSTEKSTEEDTEMPYAQPATNLKSCSEEDKTVTKCAEQENIHEVRVKMSENDENSQLYREIHEAGRGDAQMAAIFRAF